MSQPSLPQSARPAPPLPELVERQLPSGVRRYVVPAEDQLVHVMEWGSGPPVLMLHGNPTWGFLWRKVVAALGPGVRAITLDLVGLGYSSRPRGAEHTLANHRRWTRAAFDALGLSGVVLAVQDWGGPLGALLLADRPEAFRGFVVLNTGLGPPRPGFRPTTFHRFAALPVLPFVAFRALGFPQTALHLGQGDRGSIRGDVRRAYTAPLRGLRRNAAPLALARMVPNDLEHPSVAVLRDAEAGVRAFRGPAAIVWGERDPVLGRALKRATALLPEAPVTRTQGGHFLQEEVPDEIAAAIRDVLARSGG